jgi:NAD(P)-dependent dehydrogenase (short-subunit alcohol dehydrogenase family)
MSRSCVVPGRGRGIGRAITERLLAGGDTVVVVDRGEAALGWASEHSDDGRVIPPAGDAVGQAILPVDGRRSALGLDPQ